MGSGSSLPVEEENIKEEEKQSDGDPENDDTITDTTSDDNVSYDTKSEVLLQIDEAESVSKRESYGQTRRKSSKVADQSFDACDFIIAIKKFDTIRTSAPEFEISGMSANEIMKKEEERKFKEEIDKVEKAKREREIEIVKEERLYSLHNQLEARFTLLEKYQDDNLAVSQSVIDNLSNLVRKFHTKNACEEPLPILEKRHHVLEKKLRRRKRQRESLQDKLVETTPDRLQQTNPDIAELSSHSRAKKLAEQLSELYDRERQETFAATRSRVPRDVSDTEIAMCLRDLLLFCFKRCKAMSDKQTKTILARLKPVINGVVEDGKDDNKDSQPHTEAINDLACRLLIKEFQKNVCRWTLPRLKKEIPREITQEKMFDIVTKTLRAPPYQPPIKHYLDRCIEVCWFSQHHHPALTVIYDREPANRALYIPYKTEGPYISNVLWPALVQPGGPVLVKGIAIFDNKRDSNKGLQRGRRIVNTCS